MPSWQIKINLKTININKSNLCKFEVEPCQKDCGHNKFEETWIYTKEAILTAGKLTLEMTEGGGLYTLEFFLRNSMQYKKSTQHEASHTAMCCALRGSVSALPSALRSREGQASPPNFPLQPRESAFSFRPIMNGHEENPPVQKATSILSLPQNTRTHSPQLAHFSACLQ